MSSWLSIVGLVLDIAGVIGLGMYTERGTATLAGWGHAPRNRWWGALSKVSWLGLVIGFALQLAAQFVTK
jgi:hypothetical protein